MSLSIKREDTVQQVSLITHPSQAACENPDQSGLRRGDSGGKNLRNTAIFLRFVLVSDHVLPLCHRVS